jgi:precorrin-2 dehydrogenase/sirohydrochlorin ferrochelatase
MKLYPVNLDICNQLCLVVGGGLVAKRKVEALLACGPRIVLVSPELCEGLTRIADRNQIEWQQREYQTVDLQGAKLVFAATDNDTIQQKIKKEADEAGILVNVITDPESCSFQVPAMCRRGDLLLTVGTCGASPALAARIRKELETHYGEEYTLLLNLMSALREQIVTLNDDQAQHKLLFENLLNSDILALLKESNWKQLQATLENILPLEIRVAGIVNTLQTQENTTMGTLPC